MQVRMLCLFFWTPVMLSILNFYFSVEDQPDQIEDDGGQESGDEKFDIVLIEVVEEEDGEDKKYAKEVQKMMLCEHHYEFPEKDEKCEEKQYFKIC